MHGAEKHRLAVHCRLYLHVHSSLTVLVKVMLVLWETTLAYIHFIWYAMICTCWHIIMCVLLLCMLESHFGYTKQNCDISRRCWSRLPYSDGAICDAAVSNTSRYYNVILWSSRSRQYNRAYSISGLIIIAVLTLMALPGLFLVNLILLKFHAASLGINYYITCPCANIILHKPVDKIALIWCNIKSDQLFCRY